MSTGFVTKIHKLRPWTRNGGSMHKAVSSEFGGKRLRLFGRTSSMSVISVVPDKGAHMACK